MTQRTILIIGAGIGGLAAGCYARMNGYPVRILEMHTRPGGLCTSWGRDGYVFDGCIHNLAGTSADSALAPMWRELGVIPRVPMQAFEELVSVERQGGGRPFTVYTDLDRLQAHMTSLSPQDGPVIDDMIGAARRFADFDLLGLSSRPPRERLLATARAAPLLCRWGGLTLEAFARRFSDPFLRSALPTIIYDWPAQSMLMVLYFLGRASVGDLGWPTGGASALASAIEARFRELGGEIRYGAKVAGIRVEDGRATGVRLEDGSTEDADIVISNANGYATIYQMLGGRFTSRGIRAYYAAPEDRIEMGLHVSLGVSRDLSGVPHAIVLPLPQPEILAGERRERLYVEAFGFDPTLAPVGKGVLKVVLATSYSRWNALSRRPDAYKSDKAALAERVIELLEPRFPGLRQQVEVVDVATPMTTQRFTGNGHGYRTSANLAWTLLSGARLSRTLPGLRNFYMVGQWAGSPGVPMVAAMGREVAGLICKADGVRFRTKQAGSSDACEKIELQAA